MAGAQQPDADAETEATRAAREEAKAHFEKGLVLAQSARNWDAALGEFLISHKVFATRSATRNIAITLRKLGRSVEAIEWYTALLTDFPRLPADQRATVEAEMADTLRHIGEIELRGYQPDAFVIVDDVERGVLSNASTLRLDEGAHTLRVSKAGFESAQVQLRVIGGQHQRVQGVLKRLASVGRLAIREANGAELEVFVDAAVVGHTPWRGTLATGPHLVWLRGERELGTPPASVVIKQDETTSLNLRAQALNASLQVEPTPANATVFVDDIAVGSGVWLGKLPSGPHHLDVMANGYLVFRQDLTLPRGEHTTVRARLEPDPKNPLSRSQVGGPFFLELQGGALLAASLHGGAGEACRCREHPPVFGGLAMLRVGYSLGRLGLDIGGGYLHISESMTREVLARGERDSPSFVAHDYRDSTSLGGPLAALGASYRFLAKTPLTTRIGVGLAALTSNTSNSGHFAGGLTNPRDATETRSFTGAVSIGEESQRLTTPFGSTELRIGYVFSRVFSADLGAALMFFFPPNVARVGTNNLSGTQDRKTLLDGSGAKPWSSGQRIVPGLITLPRENVAGAFAALYSSVTVRARF